MPPTSACATPSTGGPSSPSARTTGLTRPNQQARARGQLHNRALRGIGARWTRILWRCWQDGITYDPTLHLKNQPNAVTA
jgi:hypothetical protein